MKWTKIGFVSVDSGYLMLGDPCYFLPSRDNAGLTYEGILDRVDGETIEEFDQEFYNSCMRLNELNKELGNLALELGMESSFIEYSEEEAKRLATRKYMELPEFKELKEGICFRNHIGDGLYPVFAKFNKDRQIVELKVSFDV